MPVLDQCPIQIPRWQASWGQHGAHLGPVGTRWAPMLAQETCYLVSSLAKSQLFNCLWFQFCHERCSITHQLGHCRESLSKWSLKATTSRLYVTATSFIMPFDLNWHPSWLALKQDEFHDAILGCIILILTLYMLNAFEDNWQCIFSKSIDIKMVHVVEMETNQLFILYCPEHGCRWPGDAGAKASAAMILA